MTSPEHVFCLESTAAERVSTWETSEDRAEMKGWILALPDPEAMWQKFLYFDEMIAHTIATECRAVGIRTFLRDEGTSVDALVHAIAEHFGMVVPMEWQRRTE